MKPRPQMDIRAFQAQVHDDLCIGGARPATMMRRRIREAIDAGASNRVELAAALGLRRITGAAARDLRWNIEQGFVTETRAPGEAAVLGVGRRR